MYCINFYQQHLYLTTSTIIIQNYDVFEPFAP